MPTSFPSPGSMNVDWEERWNVDRLRTYRLGRARAALGGLRGRRAPALRLQQHPLRHEHPHRRVGARQDDPLRAADPRRRPAHLGLRLGGQAPPAQLPVAAPGEHPRRDGRAARRGRARTPACSGRPPARSPRSSRPRASPTCRSASTSSSRRCSRRSRPRASTVRDGQQVMLDAREVKSIDEIILLNTACAMVDGAYQLIAEQLKPGVRESELVADVTKFLFDLGLGARRQHQRRLGRALQPASRTSSATGSSGPATRPSSTSSTRSSATRPATTGRSSSARPTTPSATPTSRRASGSTRRSS